MKARTRAAAAAVAGLSLAAALSGCGAGGLGGIQNLPLPGGADLGGHPYTVKARFADVLDLVPQASVRVNDVAVGRVSGIALAPDGWSATVTMKVNGAVRLPANAYAELEQSSLLGEKYVQLSAPPAGERATGRLSGGAVIPISRTNRDPQVEEVLGALSLLLNGGGLQQLHTISVELDKALTGNEPQVRDMLTQVDTLVSDLDTHKQDITDALDGVNQLSATLAARDRQIGTVLTGLSPGLKTLEQQRGSLVTMLRSLDTLSGVAVDTVNRGKADMVADLRALAPTLRRLADSGQDLPDSLQVLLTYPFTDQVLSGVKGDYLNLYLDLTAAPGTQLIPEMPADQNVYPPPTMDPGAAPAGRRPAAHTAPGAAPGTRPATTPGASGSSTAAGGLPLPLPTATTVRSR